MKTGGLKFFANIQALRAALAAAVIVAHLTPVLQPVHISHFGGGAIDLFFLISGFVVIHITRGRTMTPAAFMAARVLRIVPLYYAATLAVFAIALVAPWALHATRADGGELVKSLFFVPFEKSNGLVEPVLFPGWTLNYEMVFYGIFAIGLGAGAYRRGMLLVLAVVALLAACGEAYPGGGLFWHFYMDPIMAEFGLGIVVALVYERICEFGTPATDGLMLAAAFGGCAYLLTEPSSILRVPHILGIGLPAAAVFLCIVCLEKRGYAVRNRWVVEAGNASFAVYLIHPFFVTPIAAVMSAMHMGFAGTALSLIGCLAVTFAAGMLVHRYVEAPLARLSRDGVQTIGRFSGALLSRGPLPAVLTPP